MITKVLPEWVIKIMHVVVMQIEDQDVFLTSGQFERLENLYDLIDM